MSLNEFLLFCLNLINRKIIIILIIGGIIKFICGMKNEVTVSYIYDQNKQDDLGRNIYYESI